MTYDTTTIAVHAASLRQFPHCLSRTFMLFVVLGRHAFSLLLLYQVPPRSVTRCRASPSNLIRLAQVVPYRF